MPGKRIMKTLRNPSNVKQNPKNRLKKTIKTPKNPNNEFQMVEPVVNGLDVWNIQLLFKQMWRHDVEATTAN